MRSFALIATLLLLSTGASAFQNTDTGLFDFPLKHKDVAKKSAYTHGPYTVESINTVLDHNMSAANGTVNFDYGTFAKGTANAVIQAFNGETVSGLDPKKPGKLLPDGIKGGVCVKGWIALKPDHSSKHMTRSISECSGYTSYDDHPGYDYQAADGVPVYAAAGGTVLNNRCMLFNMSGTCSDWGAIGIQHASGYITQYLHMKGITVSAGGSVKRGQLIGYASNKAPVYLGPHLHFEVLAKSGSKYHFVDPYGWTGGKSIKDELTSRTGITAKRLWSGK